MRLTPSLKGSIAETAVIHECAKLGIEAMRPQLEGRRYDLVLDTGQAFVRAQVKSGSLKDDVIIVRTSTSRHTPRGRVRTTYTADEIDGFAVYCEPLSTCYWLPTRSSQVRERAPAGRIQPGIGQRGSIDGPRSTRFGL